MLTALYRHFDAADRLLYVGISLRPTYRLGQHAGGSHWADNIVRVTIEWLPTRPEAIEAERRAIATENPLHNIQRPIDAPEPTPQLPVPVWVDRPEFVAAHFNVSVGVVTRMIREGMPREQCGKRRHRYELRAIEAWTRQRSEQQVAERREAKRQEQEARNAHACEVMRKAWEQCSH